VANRREFLQSGLALPAALTGALTGLQADAAALRELNLERFIFDGRFPAAVRAARLAAARGIALAETAGDLTSLWYHDLDLRWRRAPMALGGVTTKGALFVLETLAADRRMRVVYRGEHGGRDATGALTQTLAGRADLFAELLPPELASRRPTATEPDEALFSWIIAPRSAASTAV
jgi:hypothetical protein